MNGDDIKEYTKDKLGAVQVLKVGEGSPNEGIFQLGDIILKVANQRVLKVVDFTKAIAEAPDKDNIPAQVVREGKHVKLNLKTINITEQLLQLNTQIINSACTVPEVQERPLCGYRAPSSDPR